MHRLIDEVERYSESIRACETGDFNTVAIEYRPVE